MSKAICASLAVVLTLGCGPEANDGEDDPPGQLEYEHPHARIYRDDRRVDVIFVTEDGERRECGMLTDRALADLEGTIDALDPSVDYDEDLDLECHSPGAGAWLHIEGFEHTPFECSWTCCSPELIRAALVYSVIEANFFDSTPIVDGEPYVAIEPDRECE